MPRPRVLYIASSSVKDPLIVSQVIRYLRRMNDAVETCHLLTLERSELTNDEVAVTRKELSNTNSRIQWDPLTARHGSRVLNTGREIYSGYRKALQLVRDNQIDLIHARSFIPGNIAMRVARKTGAMFLYDMRGFWAEEKWAKRVIRNRWLKHIAQRMEDRLFHRADALVSLTFAGQRWLAEEKCVTTPIHVIPCCADTDMFTWRKRDRSDVRRIVSVGSLGPGYLPKVVFGLFAAAQRIWPEAQLQLVTRTDRKIIENAAKSVDCSLSKVEIRSAAPDEVPALLSDADVGLCMIEPSFAKTASSPTKLAEYLACGIPVLANCEGIGDVRQIVTDNRVGVNVRSFNSDGYVDAVRELQHLLGDSTLSRRCRELAERSFSIHSGAEAYSAIYRSLVPSPQE